MNQKKKQFCVRGHDTFICGRDRKRNCKQCYAEDHPNLPKPKKQFCPKGHDTFICGRRKSGCCNQCNREYNRMHREERRQWRKEHKESSDKSTKKYRETHKEKIMDYWLRKNHNISLEEYNKILQKQNESCAGCLRHQSNFKKALCVDHDHKTGNFRGLLCNDCNTAIGKLLDSPEILRRLAVYIEENKK